MNESPIISETPTEDNPSHEEANEPANNGVPVEVPAVNDPAPRQSTAPAEAIPIPPSPVSEVPPARQRRPVRPRVIYGIPGAPETIVHGPERGDAPLASSLQPNGGLRLPNPREV